MKYNIIAIYILIYFTSCEKKIEEQYNDGAQISFEQVVNGNYMGTKSSSMLELLGRPDQILNRKNGEVWTYGPYIEEMGNSKIGEIIGVTIYFDSDQEVESIRPKIRN